MDQSFWEFAGDHPFAVFFCLFIVLVVVETTITSSLRSLVILVRGYPPEHCNADNQSTQTEERTDDELQ